jgi:hypothetical protein
VAFRWVSGQLKNIDDDKRNVILLVHCSGSPPPEFGEHLTRQLGGRLQSRLATGNWNGLYAISGVLSFGYAVGVEQEAIGWVQPARCTPGTRLRTDGTQPSPWSAAMRGVFPTTMFLYIDVRFYLTSLGSSLTVTRLTTLVVRPLSAFVGYGHWRLAPHPGSPHQ